MFRTHAPFVLVAITSLTTLTSNLMAESSRVPTPLSNRDLVVPKATLLLDGGPRWILPEGQFVYQHNPGGDPAWINAGATFGVAQDFQLGFVIPMQVLPDGFDLHDPRVHLLYQFAEGTADVGLFVQGSLPFEGNFHTIIGLPIQIHLGSVARLDTGPFVRAGFTGNDDDETYADFSVPFVLPINVSRQFFLGPETAVWTENEFDYVRVPFGVFFGYTMSGGGGTIGDLSVRWRDLNARDAGNVWQLIFAADLFFDL